MGSRSGLNLTSWGFDSQIVERDESFLTALVYTFWSSSWIWTAETNPLKLPTLDRAFRYTFTSPVGQTATSAMILLSVDDQFSFYVNGDLIGTSPTTPDNWKFAHIYNVSLGATTNIFAIRGTNSPNGGSTPAGVLAAIQISFSDGLTSLIPSSIDWRSTKIIPNGFESLSFDDSHWAPASALFRYGEGPWLTSVILPTNTTSVMTLPIPTTNPPVQDTTLPTATSDTHQSVGAIAGGVIGGIIFLLLIVLVFVWRKQRPNRVRDSLTSLLPQSAGFALEHRVHSPPVPQTNMIQPQITTPRLSQHVPSYPSAYSVHPSSVTPSMSASQVKQGSQEVEFGESDCITTRS